MFVDRVTIEVQRFESRLGDSITFDAVWMLRRTKDGNAELRRTTVREPALGNSYSELAAAHSRALLRLSKDIAKEISGSLAVVPATGQWRMLASRDRASFLRRMDAAGEGNMNSFLH